MHARSEFFRTVYRDRVVISRRQPAPRGTVDLPQVRSRAGGGYPHRQPANFGAGRGRA